MDNTNISAEHAEQVRKEALENLLNKQNEITLANLNGKFIVIKDVTDYGNLFNQLGDKALVFGIVNGNIYKLTNKYADFEAQVADPTKGELVVELNAADHKINWLQDHIEQQPFETFNSLRSSAFTGDAGFPLIQALQAHIHGTYNIAGYDTRLVTSAELYADLNDVPTSSAPQSGGQARVQAAKANTDNTPKATPAKDDKSTTK